MGRRVKTAEEYAQIILKDIHEHMEHPFPWGKTIPRDVGSYGALHNIFDANTLIIDHMDPDWEAEHPETGFTPAQVREAWEKATQINIKNGKYLMDLQLLLDCLDDTQVSQYADEDYTRLVNEVTDLVDKQLAKEASPDWCLTCGNPVHEDNCGCWAILAGYFEQYLGTDFDHAAMKAAKMWRKLSREDKLRVWRAEYAKDHFTWDHGVQVPVRTYPKET